MPGGIFIQRHLQSLALSEFFFKSEWQELWLTVYTVTNNIMMAILGAVSIISYNTDIS